MLGKKTSPTDLCTDTGLAIKERHATRDCYDSGSGIEVTWCHQGGLGYLSKTEEYVQESI